MYMKMEGLQLAMKLFDGKILKGVWLFFGVYALNVQLLLNLVDLFKGIAAYLLDFVLQQV